MAEHDLIGILEGIHTAPPSDDLLFLPHQGLTAVLSAAPRPLMRLALTRRAVLSALSARLALQDSCLPLATFLPAAPEAHVAPEAAAALIDANRPFLFEQIARHHGLVQYQIQVDWAEDRVLDRFRAAP